MADDDVFAFIGVDNVTPVIERIKGSVKSLDNTIKSSNRTQDDASKAADKLAGKLTHLEGRWIANKIGLVAMITALVSFYKSAIAAAQAADRLNERLAVSNRLLEEQGKGWRKFKEDLGAGLIEMGAAVVMLGKMAEANAKVTQELSKNSEFMKLNGIEQQRLKDRKIDEILATQEANRVLEENNKIREKYNQVLIGSYSSLDSLRTALEQSGASQEMVNAAIQKWLDLQYLATKPIYQDAFMRQAEGAKKTSEEVDKLNESSDEYLEKLKKIQQQADISSGKSTFIGRGGNSVSTSFSNFGNAANTVFEGTKEERDAANKVETSSSVPT